MASEWIFKHSEVAPYMKALFSAESHERYGHVQPHLGAKMTYGNLLHITPFSPLGARQLLDGCIDHMLAFMFTAISYNHTTY